MALEEEEGAAAAELANHAGWYTTAKIQACKRVLLQLSVPTHLLEEVSTTLEKEKNKLMRLVGSVIPLRTIKNPVEEQKEGVGVGVGKGEEDCHTLPPSRSTSSSSFSSSLQSSSRVLHASHADDFSVLVDEDGNERFVFHDGNHAHPQHSNAGSGGVDDDEAAQEDPFGSVQETVPASPRTTTPPHCPEYASSSSSSFAALPCGTTNTNLHDRQGEHEGEEEGRMTSRNGCDTKKEEDKEWMVPVTIEDLHYVQGLLCLCYRRLHRTAEAEALALSTLFSSPHGEGIRNVDAMECLLEIYCGQDQPGKIGALMCRLDAVYKEEKVQQAEKMALAKDREMWAAAIQDEGKEIILVREGSTEGDLVGGGGAGPAVMLQEVGKDESVVGLEKEGENKKNNITRTQKHGGEDNKHADAISSFPEPGGRSRIITGEAEDQSSPRSPSPSLPTPYDAFCTSDAGNRGEREENSHLSRPSSPPQNSSPLPRAERYVVATPVEMALSLLADLIVESAAERCSREGEGSTSRFLLEALGPIVSNLTSPTFVSVLIEALYRMMDDQYAAAKIAAAAASASSSSSSSTMTHEGAGARDQTAVVPSGMPSSPWSSGVSRGDGRGLGVDEIERFLSKVQHSSSFLAQQRRRNHKRGGKHTQSKKTSSTGGGGVDRGKEQESGGSRRRSSGSPSSAGSNWNSASSPSHSRASPAANTDPNTASTTSMYPNGRGEKPSSSCQEKEEDSGGDDVRRRSSTTTKPKHDGHKDDANTENEMGMSTEHRVQAVDDLLQQRAEEGERITFSLVCSFYKVAYQRQWFTQTSQPKYFHFITLHRLYGALRYLHRRHESFRVFEALERFFASCQEEENERRGGGGVEETGSVMKSGEGDHRGRRIPTRSGAASTVFGQEDSQGGGVPPQSSSLPSFPTAEHEADFKDAYFTYLSDRIMDDSAVQPLLPRDDGNMARRTSALLSNPSSPPPPGGGSPRPDNPKEEDEAASFVSLRSARGTGLILDGLQRYPGSAVPWVLLSLLLLQEGEVEDAVLAAQRAVQVAPFHLSAIFTLAYLYRVSSWPIAAGEEEGGGRSSSTPSSFSSSLRTPLPHHPVPSRLELSEKMMDRYHLLSWWMQQGATEEDLQGTMMEILSLSRAEVVNGGGMEGEKENIMMEKDFTTRTEDHHHHPEQQREAQKENKGGQAEAAEGGGEEEEKLEQHQKQEKAEEEQQLEAFYTRLQQAQLYSVMADSSPRKFGSTPVLLVPSADPRITTDRPEAMNKSVEDPYQ